jgi:ATP adenylyltransferase
VRKYLFNTEKLKYVKDRAPGTGCILCGIRDRAPGVTVLEVRRTPTMMVAVNLYPFNPGHVMVFPLRHVEDTADLTTEEALALHGLTVEVIRALRLEFNPDGFNVGYNLGGGSGASIAHLHQHVVPRYANEVGFIDVLAGTRPMVVDPLEMMERLKKRFSTIEEP